MSAPRPDITDRSRDVAFDLLTSATGTHAISDLLALAYLKGRMEQVESDLEQMRRERETGAAA